MKKVQRTKCGSNSEVLSKTFHFKQTDNLGEISNHDYD